MKERGWQRKEEDRCSRWLRPQIRQSKRASRHLCDGDREGSAVGDPSKCSGLSFHNVQFSRVTSIQELAYNPALPTRSQIDM